MEKELSDYNQPDKNANISGKVSIRKYNNKIQPNDDLLNRLKTTIPEFFDKDNNFKIDKFDSELKKNNISEAHDGYKLGFVGKDYARLQVGLKSETMIIPDCKHNSLPENANSGNIFITGDNLDALRHLVNAYENQIKLIYIDPPYNTGEEFVYSDEFEFTDEKFKTILGYTDEEIIRLKSIQGKSSHSAWLTFMYPRLKIALRLLKEDGVIFVSIDDNEQANLKLLMDDVFGESNFIGTIAWESKTKSQNTSSAFDKLQPKVEYILVYIRNGHNKFNLIMKGTKEYPNTDERGVYREYPLEIMNATGVRGRETMIYEIENISPPPGKQWQLGIEKITEYKNNNDLFVRDGKIILKMRPEQEKADITEPFWGFFSKEIGTAESAKKVVNEIFNIDNIFDTVKPVELIKKLIFHSTNKNDLIIDFFAGSSTTAHAVMQLNAEDGGNRKYILVQLDEKTKQDSEARKAKFNTIDEISRERIRLAGKKILAEYENDLVKQTNGWNKDIGFKHYRLITPDIKTLEQIDTFNPDEPMLISDDMIKPFEYKETNTSGLDTLLTTWLIDDGFTFDTEIKELAFNKYKAQYIEEAGNIYLINREWDTTALKDMLNKIGKNELFAGTIYVYPYSFDFEAMRELKTNVKNNLDNPSKIIERY